MAIILKTKMAALRHPSKFVIASFIVFVESIYGI